MILHRIGGAVQASCHSKQTMQSNSRLYLILPLQKRSQHSARINIIAQRPHKPAATPQMHFALLCCISGLVQKGMTWQHDPGRISLWLMHGLNHALHQLISAESSTSIAASSWS